MTFEIHWLESAQKEFDAEMEYVYNAFGKSSAIRAYSNIMGYVGQLASFPKIGMHCEGYLYRGQEVRMLHIRQLTLFYSFDEISEITILAVWNNYQNPDMISEMLKTKM